ncbi:hypothetical protein GCM10023352_22200 [Rothia endophytica]|uniref:RHS repeat-associated core domain-containing protein n=1 Tax=Rothia endophytica TaxID=1324766 RepID=A0ABP9BXT3_9MICC
MQVAGLEILGVRAYDAASRGFISPDPLASPVGAGWASNVYAFVGNDPVGLVDPWGLSPMTASEFREYRADTRDRAMERIDKHAGAIKTGLIIGGALLTVAGALVAGPAALIVLGALGGAALAAGFSISKDANGRVDWGKVGKSALIGGLTGAIGGGISQVLKVGGSAVASSFGSMGRAVTSRLGSSGMRVANLLGNSSGGHAVRYASARVGSAFSRTAAQVPGKFTPAVSAVGRETISGAASGAFSNTANYLSSDVDHTVSGAVSSLTNGALWGGGSAGVASRVKANQ